MNGQINNTIQNKGNSEKYLPVGTVVMLKGGTKRAMITGFCTTAKEKNDKVYDYCGCLYPEGIISSDKTLLFDHDQIEKVHFLGFIDDEEIEFKKKLNSLLNILQNSKER